MDFAYVSTGNQLPVQGYSPGKSFPFDGNVCNRNGKEQLVADINALEKQMDAFYFHAAK